MIVDADVIVVGGGPVGLAAAIEARRHGFSAVVVERRHVAADKACGEGLMPCALQALADLGVTPPGRPFRGIRYLRDGWSAEAAFERGPGRGVRRTALHACLTAAAAARGVRWHHASVRSVAQDTSGVTAAGLRGRWLVGADGLHSDVRRGAGLDRTPRTDSRARYGLRRHFRVPPWSDLVEVYWAPRAEVYVTPVAEDLVGVAVLGPARTGFDETLAQLPALGARLGGAAPVTALRGAGPLRQVSSSVQCDRVLLVGDAAGYVDALTGEGLAIGLLGARAAVQTLAAGRPQDYPGEWRRLNRHYRVLTTTVLAAAQVRAVRPLLVPSAARLPWLFERVVNQLA